MRRIFKFVSEFQLLQPDYIISNKQLRARVDRSKIDPLFAYYWFASQEMVAYIQQRNTGSSVPLINLGVLRSLPMPVPPLMEQSAITRVLGVLDDKIELNRKINETLEGMARELFKSWFVDFDPVRAKAAGQAPGLLQTVADLFPDSFEAAETGEVPKGWQVRTIGELAAVSGGGTPSTKEESYWQGGTHCWATPKDLSALNTPVLLDTERKVTDAGLGQISSGLLLPGSPTTQTWCFRVFVLRAQPWRPCGSLTADASVRCERVQACGLVP